MWSGDPIFQNTYIVKRGVGGGGVCVWGGGGVRPTPKALVPMDCPAIFGASVIFWTNIEHKVALRRSIPPTYHHTTILQSSGFLIFLC